MDFERNESLVEQLKSLLEEKNNEKISDLLKTIHSADIAEISEEFSSKELRKIIKNLPSIKAANFLSELDEEVRIKLLQKLEVSEIAQILEEMDTDDAADVLSEIQDEDEKQEILELIDDKEHAWEITELASYKEWTAGSLMAKEYIDVKQSWTIDECLKEVRRQAQVVDRVHSIYLVDNKWVLTGRVSLKDLISAPWEKKVEEIKKKRVDSVVTDTPASEVAYLMEKYNMEAIPVIDELWKLLGRITIDDVIDYVRDTAEENYNLASGILDDVEEGDKFRYLVKARLPWLILALIWWLMAVNVMWGFEEAMETNGELFFFTPLIAAMAWNVWVQSSALVVQALANGSLKWWLFARFFRELSLSLVNWLILSTILLIFWFLVFWFSNLVIIAVCISLVSVILLASMIGTFVPLILNKFGINPAMATWPFITTSNDIFGILIFFSIAKVVIGF